MARHLSAPTGNPDPDAQAIIDAINAYTSANREPALTALGLRHIFHHVELAWNASLASAKEIMTFERLARAVEVTPGTLQARIRAHAQQGRQEVC